MFTHSIDDERGFTLIELLVVVMIIGILAAVALPNFLGQRAKGQDGVAKADARSTLSHVEACFIRTDDYRGCRTSAELGRGNNLPIGTARGQVEITAGSADGFLIRARSESGGNFDIVRDAGTQQVRRECSPAGSGGCGEDGRW